MEQISTSNRNNGRKLLNVASWQHLALYNQICYFASMREKKVTTKYQAR